MRRLLLAFIFVIFTMAPAQAQLFSCWDRSPQIIQAEPRIIQVPTPAPSPNIDLSRLETIGFFQALELRYQSAELARLNANTQRIGDFLYLSEVGRSSAGVPQSQPQRYGLPPVGSTSPTPLPSPESTKPVPLPGPESTRPTPLPGVEQTEPTPLPGPGSTDPINLPGGGVGVRAGSDPLGVAIRSLQSPWVPVTGQARTQVPPPSTHRNSPNPNPSNWRTPWTR